MSKINLYVLFMMIFAKITRNNSKTYLNIAKFIGNIYTNLYLYAYLYQKTYKK